LIDPHGCGTIGSSMTGREGYLSAASGPLTGKPVCSGAAAPNTAIGTSSAALFPDLIWIHIDFVFAKLLGPRICLRGLCFLGARAMSSGMKRRSQRAFGSAPNARHMHV